MTPRWIITFGAVVLVGALLPSLGLSTTLEEEQLELKMREIAKTLRCAVCQNESIWESNSELARQMRDLIRERLLRGESPDEIRAYFHSRYGDYILLVPRRSGLNWILWAGPFVLLATGGLLLYRSLSRWVHQEGEAAVETPPPIEDSLRRRIEEEMHRRED